MVEPEEAKGGDGAGVGGGDGGGLLVCGRPTTYPEWAWQSLPHLQPL